MRRAKINVNSQQRNENRNSDPDLRRSSSGSGRIGHNSNAAKGYKGIGEAKDGEEACRLYDTLLPDILLLDLRMPKKDGLEVITELMSRTPSPRIIVLTTYEATEDIRLALTAGAKGYMLKDTESPQVWDTVRKVFAGESLLSPGVATKLVDSLAQPIQ